MTVLLKYLASHHFLIFFKHKISFFLSSSENEKFLSTNNKEVNFKQRKNKIILFYKVTNKSRKTINKKATLE